MLASSMMFSVFLGVSFLSFIFTKGKHTTSISVNFKSIDLSELRMIHNSILRDALSNSLREIMHVVR